MPLTTAPSTTAAQACVELLEQVLADAKAGKVTTVGVVCCGPADFGSAHAGPDAARLNMGIDVLKRNILEACAPSAPPPPSPIKRPSIIHRA